MSAPLVRRLPANTLGRDWVVGDIHGAFDLVITAMRVSGFDRRVDRLFVVGDLVDRGDDSLRALKFLEQPYVHCLRGNHEDMWLGLYQDTIPSPEVVLMASRAMRMGGLDWWFKAPPAERNALVAKFRELPIVIEVETPRGLVGMIHADVPAGMSWQQFVAAIEAGDERATQTALWGRTRAHQGNTDGVAGVGRIFAGHTPQDAIRRLGNVYLVDTGAIFGLNNGADDGRLSMMNIVAKTGDLATLYAPTENGFLIDVRSVTDNPPEDAPFGSYAVSAG
jgi:serine/threonine protein phosphatase 1